MMKKNDETIGSILQDVRDVMDEMEDNGEEIAFGRIDIEEIFDRIEQAYLRMGQKFAIEMVKAIDEVRGHYEKKKAENEPDD